MSKWVKRNLSYNTRMNIRYTILITYYALYILFLTAVVILLTYAIFIGLAGLGRIF